MTKEEAIAAAQATYRDDPDYCDRRICRLEPRRGGSGWIVLAWFGIVCRECESPEEVSSMPQWFVEHITPIWRDGP